MAITAQQRKDIVKLAVEMFNVAPGVYLQDLVYIYESNGNSLQALANVLVKTETFKENVFNPTILTTEEVATKMTNGFGMRDVTTGAGKEAHDYFLAQLNAGKSIGDLYVEGQNYLSGEPASEFLPVAKAIENKTIVAEYYTIKSAADEKDLGKLAAVISSVNEATDVSTDAAIAQIIEQSSAPATNHTFVLTDGVDNIIGSAEDDMIIAAAVQNNEGAITNQLATGDFIDGGAGNDEVVARVIPDQITQGGEDIEINPVTKNVEIATIEVIDGSVRVDAGRMDSVKEFWSDDSEGNLTIEDIRLGSKLSVTKDITFGIKDVDYKNDFSALFESASLTNEGTKASNSEIVIEVGYEDAPTGVTDTNATKDLFVKIKFTHDGQDFDSGFLKTTGTSYPETYEGLKELIQATLKTQGFDDLEVVLGKVINSITTGAGKKVLEVPAQQIIIKDPSGAEFTNITSAAGTESSDPTSDVASRIEAIEPITSTTLIESNLILDNAGRGSTAGEVKIGAMSNSKNGVQKFNVQVDHDSAIKSLFTTNNKLQEVIITSTVNSLKDTTTAKGTLEVGSITNWNTSANTTIDASAFQGGSLMLGQTSEIEGSDIMNLNTLKANIGANVRFDANVDGTVNGQAYNYITGSGTDIVNVTLDGDAVDALGESFSLKTNDGKDTVKITMDPVSQAGVSQNTMKLLKNLELSTGAGDDSINLDGYGNFNITAGAGSDFIRINSVDTNGDATTLTATVGNATGSQTWGDNGRVLYNAEVTVNFAGIESTVDVKTDAAHNFIATQSTINQAIIDAIAASPELSKLVSATLKEGTQQLEIKSKVGGENDLSIDVFQPQLIASGTVSAGQTLIANNDVDALRQGLLATETVTNLSDDLENASEIVGFTDGLVGIDTFYGSIDKNGTGNKKIAIELSTNSDDKTVSDLVTDGAYNYMSNTKLGTDAIVGVNYSTINAGSGSNDIIVLHSNDLSMNTIVIDGAFGKDTVVNFFDTAPTDADGDHNNVGLHRLDFTSILNNEKDSSTKLPGNTESAKAIKVTLHDAANTYTSNAVAVNDKEASANSVNVLHFDESVTNSIKFSELTADKLKSKLNDQAGAYSTVVGGIDHTSLTIKAYGTELVGTTQHHIIMVENKANLGEYKVFSATSTLDSADKSKLVNNEDDFTTVTELGTLDFGHSINFNLVGDDSSGNMLQNLLNSADKGSSVTVDGEQKVVVTTENQVVIINSSTNFDTTNGTGIEASHSTSSANDYIVVKPTTFSEESSKILDGQDGVDTLTFATNADYNLTNVVISNIEYIDLANINSKLTTKSSQLSGKDYEFLNGKGKTVVVNGSNDKDTINLSSLVGTSVLSFEIDGADDADEITGGAGNDKITGGAGNDKIIGGAGDDTLVVDGSDTVIDGGSDTDTVKFAENINVSSATFTGVEKLEKTGNGDNIKFTLKSNQLSGITHATGVAGHELNLVVNGADVAGSTADTINLSGITFSNATTTIKGGAGADVITLGDGVDTVVFADTAVHNGSDTINGFTTTADKINVDAFVSSVTGEAFVDFNGAQKSSVATGSIINLESSSQISASDLAAKFVNDDDDDTADGGGESKMEVDDSAKIIVIVQDNNATDGDDFDAQMFYLESNDDGSTITTTLVGTFHNDSDSQVLAFGDFA